MLFKRGCLLSLCVLLCLLASSALSEGLNRAMLVGCDRFVTQPHTTPSSANNVTRMADTLSGGAMNLEALVTRRNDLSSVAELESLILDAFGDAENGDVSYFYISTHGVWEQGQRNGAMQLLLSDGEREEAVTAEQLRLFFDKIRGTKVLIVDACHAGAMIGKGVRAPFDNVFAGPDYVVLCSSGGAEESWFWAGMGDEPMAGAGYFSSALVSGMSIQGSFAADSNRDGNITLSEMKRYLRANHGASTPHTYPEESDFSLFRYDAEAFTGRRHDANVEGLTFVGDVLEGDLPQVDFSFTMLRPTRIAYQLVFQENGKWDFEDSELLWDNTEEPMIDGLLSPGMKERTLTLDREDTGSYGYVLVQMLAFDGAQPELVSSRVLCATPLTGDPLLSVETDGFFCPELYQEMNLVVLHEYPCELSVVIEDAEGNVVRRLASRQASRPEQLDSPGSSFCWDGKTSGGDFAPEGSYRARVTAWVGTEKYQGVSNWFTLLVPVG